MLVVGACEKRRRRRRPRRRFFPSPLHRVDKNVASLLLLDRGAAAAPHIWAHKREEEEKRGPPPNSIPQREEGRGGGITIAVMPTRKNPAGEGRERKKEEKENSLHFFLFLSDCAEAGISRHLSVVYFFGVSCKDKNVFSEREKYTGNLQPPPPLPRLRGKLFCALQKRLAACKSN